MRKVLLIAKRDYLAAVRTKTFLIGLLAAPLLFGGSFLATVLLKGQPTKQVGRIAVMDETGIAARTVIEQLKQQNLRDRFDKNTGAQIMPKYEFEIVPYYSEHPGVQRLILSNRVRNKDLFGFLEIEPASAKWYSNEGGFAEVTRWLAGPVNDGIRRIRLKDLGISGEQLDQALKPVPLESMSLVARDRKTGQIAPAQSAELPRGSRPRSLRRCCFL